MEFSDIIYWIKVIMGIWFTFAFLYWLFIIPFKNKKKQWKDKTKEVNDFWNEHKRSNKN